MLVDVKCTIESERIWFGWNDKKRLRLKRINQRIYSREYFILQKRNSIQIGYYTTLTM
jgi:hypothetical protein